MKITKTKNKDDITVWDIRIGYSELLALSDLVTEAHSNAPKLFETMPARARIRGMHKDLNDAVLEHGGGKRKKWDLKDFVS